TTDQVPIFDIQGWTDNLFPEAEGVSLANKLRQNGWPVKIAVADAGHPLAQNKAAMWSVLNAQANAFLDHYLISGAAVPLDSSAQVTTCDGSAGATYTSGTSWAGLAPYRITLSSGTQKATTSAADSEVMGTQTDPITVAAVHGGSGACVVLPATGSLPTAFWDFPVTNAFTLLGEPALHLEVTVAGVDAEINARLWDVSAGRSSKTLVTRAAYRFTGTAGAISIDIPLQGNGWNFAVGHTIRLQVTQVDAAYLRPDTFPSAVTYNTMSLVLPTPTAPPSTSTTGPTTSAAMVTQLAATGGRGSRGLSEPSCRRSA
ncbi:MAG TPA: CocE/NonD family hydrolase C-terminal non-catalytic domain-containing protein, partial [Candidatus Dormibacteraeota bacterium]|nr:CocE/NonD family hydrolase C-terminal non-catalytic domain-containing protein [Candidatus Dormibacteraeota bacterium]